MTDHFAWPLGREFGTGRRLDALDGRKLDGTGRTRPPLRGRPASSLSNQPRVKYDPMANEEGDNMT